MNVVRRFRGVEYHVSYETSAHGLGIRIEESLTSEVWSAQFSGQYVEELTQKTGNYKSLDLFVRCAQANPAPDTLA